VTAKKSKAIGPPAFEARTCISLDRPSPGDIQHLTAMFEAIPKTSRDAVAKALELLRTDANKALAAPDIYDTHAPANRILGAIAFAASRLDAMSDDALIVVHELMMAGQAHVVLRVNARLSEPINQVRRRILARRSRPKPGRRKTQTEILAVLEKGGSVKEQMKKLGYSRAQITVLRRKFQDS
jgi:hypothetical protein